MPKLRSFHKFARVCVLLITGIVVINPTPAWTAAQTSTTTATDTACRFGITSVEGSEGYNIASIGTGSYLDWGAGGDPDLPEGIEYIRVLRLRNDLYPQTLASLPDWIETHPGSIWVVGNEPDTIYEHQDALLPEVYADRYHEVAELIRSNDPTAKIAFGPVVQPTSIRIRYLQRAWDHLADDAGGYSAASSLIDIWSIHSFILNEQYGSWGTGIPPGFENDYADAFIIDFDHLYYTYSNTIFEERVIAFRQWMTDIGERDKPLWITEYGSLMPPEDPPEGPDYVNVSNELTAEFMVATFDFMMSAQNNLTGFPGDGNQLVQRWFWYSLNDYPYHYGGSIFDPRDKSTTLVGEYFIGYQPLSLAQPDLFPVSLSIAPVAFNPYLNLATYKLELKVGNAVTANAGTTAEVQIYDGDPANGGALIAGPITTDIIQRCGGVETITVYWDGVQPQEEHTLYVDVEAIGVIDSDLNNNQAQYRIVTVYPKLSYLPMIGH